MEKETTFRSLAFSGMVTWGWLRVEVPVFWSEDWYNLAVSPSVDIIMASRCAHSQSYKRVKGGGSQRNISSCFTLHSISKHHLSSFPLQALFCSSVFENGIFWRGISCSLLVLIMELKWCFPVENFLTDIAVQMTKKPRLFLTSQL